MSSIKPSPTLDQTPNSPADDYIPGEFGEESASSEFPEFTPEKSLGPPITVPPVLIMAAPQPPRARFGTLFWLAHTLGLDIYGTTALSYAARTEMSAAALVLTIIFLFDAGAWCLLFYFILNSGSLNFQPGLLVLSLAGILPALALLLYERSFMTADTKTYGWRRLMLPTVLRVCVIFCAAWMTAQPVELMAFQRRIERRVMDELIRRDIVAHSQKLQKAEDDQKKGGTEMVGRDSNKLDAAENELKTTKGHVPAAEAELEKRKQAKAAAETRLKEAKSQLKEAQARAKEAPDSSDKRDLVASRQKAADSALAAYNERAQRQSEQQGVVDTFNKSIKSGEADVADRRDKLNSDYKNRAAAETEENLLRWADKLREITPGEDFPLGADTDKETGYKFKFADYSFLDKFRIIDDVLAGRPARWPGAQQDEIKFLQKKYGLYDDHDNVADSQGQERLAAETKNARRTYYAVFGVALLIPFMSLLFKVIMPAPLSYYYSSGWQSQQGHPEAMALEAAAYSMRVRSHAKSKIFSSKSRHGAA